MTVETFPSRVNIDGVEWDVEEVGHNVYRFSSVAFHSFTKVFIEARGESDYWVYCVGMDIDKRKLAHSSWADAENALRVVLNEVHRELRERDTGIGYLRCFIEEHSA